MEKGVLNRISDVKGIRVGHKTIQQGDIQTGVSVLIPSDTIFKKKFPAAAHVINGYGKTTGLLQIEELGTLESIIGLTNTLSVGSVQQGIIKYMLETNKDIGTYAGTVNPIVGECNDGYLNDIRKTVITQQDVMDAIADAKEEFALGNVGAGTGMSCFELKGGIGSSSRRFTMDHTAYHVGALVLTNFGLLKDFQFHGVDFSATDQTIEQGSIIIILATDLPMSDRQLKRMCKRTPIALAHLGSHLGTGSGDIALAFSTGNIIKHYEHQGMITMQQVNENKIDMVFEAAIEASEEAILSSLLHAETITGRDGHIRYSLKDKLKDIGIAHSVLHKND